MDFGLIFGIAIVAAGIYVAAKLGSANGEDDLDPNNRL